MEIHNIGGFEMEHIQTINHSAHTVYDMFFLKGKLMRLRYWDLSTTKEIYNVARSDGRIIDLFTTAIITLCHDYSLDKYTYTLLISSMYDDEELISKAKEIMRREVCGMAEQVAKITSLKIF